MFNTILTLKEHTNFINQVIELSNYYLASGSKDQTIKLWDLKSNRSIQTINLSNSVFTIIQLKDSRIAFAGGGKNNDVSIKFLEKDIYKKLSPTLNGHTNLVLSLIELRDGRLASASYDKTIKIWDLKEYKCIMTLTGHEDTIEKLIEIRESLIISCSWDGTLRIWDFKKNPCIQIIKEHVLTVYSVIELKDGRIVSASADKTIKIFSNK
jgi:WD40 repeat protein